MIFKKLSTITNYIKATISFKKATVFAKRRKGFSLIEVVIAMTLMAVKEQGKGRTDVRR